MKFNFSRLLHSSLLACINVWLFPLALGTDDNAYKVQEYFSYNQNSFYDLECDLEKHRLEQPSPTKD